MTHENSWLHRVWSGWRREIVRGAVLFAVVVAIGLFIAGQIRAFDPLALMRSGGLNIDFGDHGNREWVSAGRFAGTLQRGETVWIRSLNGEVTVGPATGDSFVVEAEKSWRRSDPQSVEVMMLPRSEAAGGVTICALWPARTATCEQQGHYKVSGTTGHNDVAVRFVVRLPARVRLDASTINGAIAVHRAASPLALETVNGAITLETAEGPVTASTVNGSIRAALLAVTSGEAVELKTVNGSITASVPRGLDAALEASTVNGRVSSDLPLQVIGKINPRRLTATIGNGGPPLRLKTVNGSVTIAELGPAEGATPAVAPVPPTPPAPPARRAGSGAPIP